MLFVERDIATDCKSYILFLYEDGIEGELSSLVEDRSHVPVLELVSRSGSRELDEQVFCGVLINFDTTGEPALEECEIETDVVGYGCFPSEVRICHDSLASYRGRSPWGRAAIYPSGFGGGSTREEHCGHSCRDIVVSRCTVAVAQLEIVEPGRAYFQVGNNEIFELFIRSI